MSLQDPYASLWVYLDIEHTDRVLQLRDILAHAINTSEFILEDDPHITLHRGFQVQISEISQFRTIISDSDLVGRSITITGVKFWPSINTPHVVMLDIDIDLEPTKSELEQVISYHGGAAFHDPVPPHITLFRADLRSTSELPDLSEQACDKLFAIQNALQFPWQTEITDITLGVYDLPRPDGRL